MSRVNVYVNVRSEARETSVSIGGRAKNNWTKAWFNTATKGPDVPLSVTAEVLGEKTRKTDERMAYFTIELPPAADSQHFNVEITENGSGMKALARFGAALVTLKDLMAVSDPDPQIADNGQRLIDQAEEILESLVLKMDDVPENVTIMGKNLRHLLACATLVEMMLKEQEERKPGEN